MPRLNLDIDEATLLKAYKIGSLNPTYACFRRSPNRRSCIFNRQWEDVDHDLDDSVPGTLLSPTGSGEGDGDCLGLESDVK
jgi:exocyst complex component 2